MAPGTSFTHDTGVTRRRWLLGGVLAGCAGAGAAAAWHWLRPGAGQAAFDALAGDICVVAPPTPFNAALGQPLAAPRDVPAEARCPVCGMFPARSRAWAAQAIFASGEAHFFDSPVSLLQYLGNVGHYTPGRTAADIVARYVTDTDSGAWLDAQAAVYVAGSSAKGPMRAGNLPAFADAVTAARFAQQRGGRPLAFGAIDAPLLRSLAPNPHAGHGGPARGG